MSSYVALTLVLVAFGWYWMETESFTTRSPMGPYLVFTIGAAAYLVIRVYLFKFSQALKKVKRR
jgi:hypothetical protein